MHAATLCIILDHHVIIILTACDHPRPLALQKRKVLKVAILHHRVDIEMCFFEHHRMLAPRVKHSVLHSPGDVLDGRIAIDMILGPLKNAQLKNLAPVSVLTINSCVT